jgi:hypothetical protein
MSPKDKPERLSWLVEQALIRIRMARQIGWAEGAHQALALYSRPIGPGLVPLDLALERIGLGDGQQFLADKLSQMINEIVDVARLRKHGVTQEVIDALVHAKPKDTPKQREKDLSDAYRELGLRAPRKTGCLLIAFGFF